MTTLILAFQHCCFPGCSLPFYFMLWIIFPIYVISLSSLVFSSFHASPPSLALSAYFINQLLYFLFQIISEHVPWDGTWPHPCRRSPSTRHFPVVYHNYLFTGFQPVHATVFILKTIGTNILRRLYIKYFTQFQIYDICCFPFFINFIMLSIF